MRVKRTAVIEDMDAFMDFLASMPLMKEVRQKLSRMDAAGNLSKPAEKPASSSAVDSELLNALKSMA